MRIHADIWRMFYVGFHVELDLVMLSDYDIRAFLWIYESGCHLKSWMAVDQNY